FSLPLNIIPEFSNIRYVTVTVSKLLGGENKGTAGIFGAEGGNPSTVVWGTTRNVEDANGWSIMQFDAKTQNIGLPGVSGKFDHEREIDSATYCAQRFQTTQSTGAFLIRFAGRIPAAGASEANQ